MAKYALLVGNDEYQDPKLSELAVPSADVEAFQSVLSRPDICAFDDVKILLNARLEQVAAKVDDLFSGRRRDDLVFLYFSGHGALDRRGKLYLLLTNSRHDRLISSGLASSVIKDAMDLSLSRRQVLVLDCCHSGAFGRESEGGIKEALGAPAVTEDTFNVGGYGRVILTSSTSTQISWEGGKVVGNLTRSLFTHYLVEGLETGAAAEDKDEITIEQLYHYANDQVLSIQSEMTPQRWVDKQQGTLVIARNPHPTVKPKPLPVALLAALENSEPFIREGAVREIGRHLNSQDSGIVLAACEALKRRESVERDVIVLQAIKQFAEKEPEPEPEDTPAAEPTTSTGGQPAQNQRSKRRYLSPVAVSLSVAVAVAFGVWIAVDFLVDRIEDPIAATPAVPSDGVREADPTASDIYTGAEKLNAEPASNVSASDANASADQVKEVDRLDSIASSSTQEINSGPSVSTPAATKPAGLLYGEDHPDGSADSGATSIESEDPSETSSQEPIIEMEEAIPPQSNVIAHVVYNGEVSQETPKPQDTVAASVTQPNQVTGDAGASTQNAPAGTAKTDDDSQQDDVPGSQTGDDVSALAKEISPHFLQLALKDLGYYGGWPDGVIGRKSRRAIMAFQRAQGFEPTGYLNDSQTVTLVKTAADAGHPQSLLIYGLVYARAEKPHKDLTAAREAFQASSDKGNSDASYNLGVFYRDGHGVVPSIAKAHEYFDLARQQGHPEADEAIQKLKP